MNQSDNKVDLCLHIDDMLFKATSVPSSFVIDGHYYWIDNSLTLKHPAPNSVKIHAKETDSRCKIQRRIRRKLKELENPPHYIWKDPMIARPDVYIEFLKKKNRLRSS